MLNVSNPASRAHPTARTTDRTPCCRPNDANTCGTIDCTPNETRVPPARRYETSEDGDTLSGLHSTVTSAPGASRTSPSPKLRQLWGLIWLVTCTESRGRPRSVGTKIPVIARFV